MSLFCVMTERTNYRKPERVGNQSDCLGYFQALVIDNVEGGIYICACEVNASGKTANITEVVEYQRPIMQPFCPS